jgi:chaperone modulatory protein CbpM
MTEEELLRLIDGLDAARLETWRATGWVRPRITSTGLDYAEVDVARTRLIVEMQDAMALDEEAVPVVLSLLDQVYGLRYRLRSLARAVKAQPQEIQAKIWGRLAEED